MADIKKVYADAAKTTQLYPITHEKAVIDNNGANLASKMGMLTDLVNQKQMDAGAVPSDLTPTIGSTNWVTSDGVAKMLPHIEETAFALTASKIIEASSTSSDFGSAISASDSNYKVTDYIDVSDVVKIQHCLVVKSSTNASIYGHAGYVFYDGNKEPISGVVTASNASFSVEYVDIDVPSGASYFRTSTNNGASTLTIRMEYGAVGGSLVASENDLAATNSVVNYLIGQAVATFADITTVGETNASTLDISLDTETETVKIDATGSKTTSRYAWLNLPTSLVDGKQYRLTFDFEASIGSGCDGYLGMTKGHSSGSDYLGVGVAFSTGHGKKSLVFTKTSSMLYLMTSSYSVGGTGCYIHMSNVKFFDYVDSENIPMLSEEISELQDHTFDNANSINNYYGVRIPSLGKQKIGMKKLMNNASCQAGAAYGGYYFQFTNYHTSMNVYSLVTKTLHSTVQMTTVSTDHCNTVCFSNKFYDSNDDFPLLYTSGSQTATYNHIQVWRIQLSSDVFTITQVQEITLPTGTTGDSWNWGQAYLDNEANFLWYSTMMSSGIYFRRFAIPAIFDSSDNVISSVTLTEDDVKDSFTCIGCANQQGGVVRNGILYLLDGVPAWGTLTKLYVYDLWNKGLINIIDIYHLLGITDEFEGCGIYNDTLIANTNGGGIYAIYF